MANLVENNTKSTLNQPIGLLLDGVEVYSPSLFDESIYFGAIHSVNILNSGENYDVITPPEIEVINTLGNGEGAKITGNLKGELKEVLVISPGVGYKKRPVLNIKGGNLTGDIKLETNLIKKIIKSSFLPSTTGVGNSTITFINPHNFEDGEEIVYITNNTPTIVGLTTDSTYYANILSSNSISLYKNYSDFANKVNVIDGLATVVGVNTGVQEFWTKNYKNIIDKVYIDSDNAQLYNTSISINSNLYPNTQNVNGININSDYIYAKNHNFKEKDLILYQTTGTSITGLSTTTQYYVSVLDSDRFQLADAGYESAPDDTNYKNKTYVSLNSVGVGIHTFRYPPITVEASIVAESSLAIAPTLKPVVLGSFESVFIQDGGVGYGLSEVVNIKNPPEIRIKGQNYFDSSVDNEAVLRAVIESGKIVNVIILKPGKNYQDNIDIIVGGSGKYAKLYPNVLNGEIISVDIISPGVGYSSKDTSLLVQRRGKNAKFLANVTKWTIDQYFKNKEDVDTNSSNGYAIPSKNLKNSIQFVNFFPSNNLRSKLNDTRSKIKNSPILGWAYDGNPIFGPYVVENNAVKSLTSGYRIKNNILELADSNRRPSSAQFNFGSFIEDYEYVSGVSDLDENNGMFVYDRDEFPTGTYAYFMTVNQVDSPVFPYVIGNQFKNIPDPLNTNPSFNQNIDFTSKNYIKNTSSLYLNTNNSGYDYLRPIQDKYKQELIVKNVTGSKLEGFKILNSGQNYKVGDNLLLEVENESDPAPSARVSRINGKTITNVNIGITSTNSVRFKNEGGKIIGICTIPHELGNDQFVYISDSQNELLNGNKKIKVVDDTYTLYSSHDSVGITTYITLNDVSSFSINDYIQIDNEIAKVLEIHSNSSKLFVTRLQNVESHTAGISTVKILPTKFEFTSSKIVDSLSVDNNRYFNPRISVGLGTTGSIIIDSNINANYFVQEKCIYIPNHQFETNQPLIYESGVGFNGLLVSSGSTSSTYRLTSGQTVYAINVSRDSLGISTVAYGTTAVTFRESAYLSDEYHSFNFIGTSITGKAETYSLSFATEENHQLLNNDKIRLSGKENTWEFYAVQFDLNSEYEVQVNSPTAFRIDLNDKPQFIQYFENNSLSIVPFTAANLNYNTNSLTALGGINDIHLNFTGNSYRNIPILKEIQSASGVSAIVVPYSTTIGKIDTVERIKDGFDYPSDITLQPKLSTTTICYLDNVNKVGEVKVTFGGFKYNTPPALKVVGNDDIILSCTLRNSSVYKVQIEQNSSNLSNPLEIIPISNSNGLDILDVYSVNSTTNRIEVDINQFPLIYRDYAEPYVDFPFNVGDSIFIENCRILETNKNTYNSSDNSYTFFDVVGINTTLGYIDYRIDNVTLSNSQFGTYSNFKGYGTVVNKKNMATFEMILEKENYIPNESIIVLDEFANVKFSGQVMAQDGWDKTRNQLRIAKSIGVLDVNDIVFGSSSLLKGKVLYVNGFSLKSSFGSTREKINYKDNITDLNSDLKKLQDSYYYQDFSYSIRSKVPYEIWSEPVRSIVHPSGFKEFSDLQVLSIPSNNLKVKTTDSLLDFDVKIENENSFFTRTNFTIGYEDEKINDTTTERVYMGSGVNDWPIAGYGYGQVKGLELLPYILNKTNDVKILKPIDDQFTGSYENISLGNYSVTFNSNSLNYLGITTDGLETGDYIGYSTNLLYPYSTRILSVGINSVRILHPHNVISGIVTESLEITRNLNHNQIVGLTSFRLVDINNSPIYTISGIATQIDLTTNTINIDHNFQTGQKIIYKNINGNSIGISTTSDVIGGISTDKLPSTLYVYKVSDNKFKVSGLSTSNTLDLTYAGSGIHQFSLDSPESSTLISIDNIIQTPVHPRTINLQLSSNVGIGSTVIYVNSGINSITSVDILKIENEYMKINSIGINSTTSVEVERGFLGTSAADHTGVNTAYVYRGNYRIQDDIIYFTSPPYGPTGLTDLEVSSNFSGRFFSRTFSPSRPNDKNIILDDISDEFIGISSFVLKENGNNVVGLYTNTNDPNSININNNPFIFINNIPQVTHIDYEIIEPNQNKIEFITGNPKSGKLLRVDIQSGYGYSPLVGAAATVNVSTAGTISNVYLNGPGSGYRSIPAISIISSSGYGASITATVSAAGTITSLSIVNPGIGYTSSEIPQIIIDPPLPYYNLDLIYDNTSIGIGTEAKVSLVVESDSSIQKVEIINSGENYKVGDKLNVVGVKTDVGIGSSFSNLVLTVKEVISDDFTGIYPGQFIQLDDISSQFNSLKTVFDITTNINGQKTAISFKNSNKNIRIENNFFIFINGILQEPSSAYRYIGGRLVFSEPPKEESTCNILYYQGSISDIELITPTQTIKSGDEIKFEDSEISSLDSEQTERVVKRLISSNSLDTFAYSGFGIGPIVRPISWTKQKNDRIISGSLIPKGRDSQRSRIYPNAKLIKNIRQDDTNLYVDNAYPLFIELDNGIGGVLEEKRNINIVNQAELEYPEFTVNVSSSSTVASVNITNSGVGYSTTPNITVSYPDYKDPFYSFNGMSNINTSLDFNSVYANDIIITVGESNLIGTSKNFVDWSIDTISIPVTTNLQKIVKSNNGPFVSVGSSGVIIQSNDGYSNWSQCGIKTEIIGPLGISLGFATSYYVQTFNDVIYNEYIDAWVAVGDGGKIYKGVGIGTTVFIESISQSFDYKSITYNSNIMIAVGNQGISTSNDGKVWYNVPNISAYNYSSVVFDDPNFIVTTNNGLYKSSNNGLTWSKITNSPINIKKLIKSQGVYLGISLTGDLYKTLNLTNWIRVNSPSSEVFTDIGNYKLNSKEYHVCVGLAGTALYSEIKLNKATLSATVSNSQITAINVINGGFGYTQDNSPSILIESPKAQYEEIYTIKAEGDYGKIVGIKTSNTGIGTNSPSISFELITDYSMSGYESLNTFGITYSHLAIGDYFVISNSNINTITGYALTGITTSLGGMANYPASRIGTATTYLDGVYRVEYAQYPSHSQGITTVTCHIMPVNGGIGINTSGITTSYYGNYSWSKIYDFEDRTARSPKNFNVNLNDGLVGLNTAPSIYRMPPLAF